MPPKTQSVDQFKKYSPASSRLLAAKLSLFRTNSDALRESFEYVRAFKPIQPTDEKLIFYLPLSPLSSNSCMHWRSKEELKRQYRLHFEQMQLERLLPAIPAEPWEAATVTVKAFVKAKNDRDNLVSRIKQSIDLIVRTGYLVDDGPERLHWAGFPEQKVDRRIPAYVVITLTKGLEIKP